MTTLISFRPSKMLCAFHLLVALQLTTCVLGKSIYGGMKLDNIGVHYIRIILLLWVYKLFCVLVGL